MSEDLTVLQEYLEGLNLKPTKMTVEDLVLLRNELKDAGEFGLARLIESLNGPEELLDYVGEEE